MRWMLLCGALIAALALPVAANAATWKPGTPMYISEKDAVRMLEQEADHAYCDGIPRFGHRGEFPSEEFRMFDCSIKLNGVYCPETRWRAIKDKRRNFYNLRRVGSMGSCY